MGNKMFDYKKFLVENRMTENSRGNEHRNRFLEEGNSFRINKIYEDDNPGEGKETHKWKEGKNLCVKFLKKSEPRGTFWCVWKNGDWTQKAGKWVKNITKWRTSEVSIDDVDKDGNVRKITAPADWWKENLPTWVGVYESSAEPVKEGCSLDESGDMQFIDSKTGKEIKEGRDPFDHHDPEYNEDDLEQYYDPDMVNEIGYTDDDFDDEFTDPDELDSVPEEDFKNDFENDDDEEDPEDEQPESTEDTNPEEIENFCNEIESRYPGEIEWYDMERLHSLLKGRGDTIDKSRAARFWNKAIKAAWDYFKEFDYPNVLAVDFSYTKGEEDDEDGNNGYILKRILPHPLCKVYRPEGVKPNYEDED